MRLRRSLVFAAICGVHALLLTALCIWRLPISADRPIASDLVVLQIARPARTAPARVPSKAEAPAPPFKPAPASPEPTSCDVGGALAAALATDEEAGRRLAALPASDRSVANTVMLWDGQWAEAPSADDGTGSLQRSIKVVLKDQPSACLDQPIVGPRLVMVATAPDAISLMFGSGAWRWRDLLRPTPEIEQGSLSQASIGSHQLP